MNKPRQLYHGSSHKIDLLKPILIENRPGYEHQKAAVFGTERIDIAALFMFPYEILSSIGFEKDIAFICIWGTPKELENKNFKGYLYTLPTEFFEKVGKEYEWQSFQEVRPIEVKEFGSPIKGMIENNVQVYFINDNSLFDKIVENKYHRASILKNLISENQKLKKNIKVF